jgi:predicted site-specific integrase-resolvase
LYCLDGVLALLGRNQSSKRGYIYARVSSTKQRPDLDRQCTDLQEAYPEHVLVKDIASGVNFKRRGMQTLLEQALKGMVSEIVVLHRDRLARLG